MEIIIIGIITTAIIAICLFAKLRRGKETVVRNESKVTTKPEVMSVGKRKDETRTAQPKNPIGFKVKVNDWEDEK